MQITTLIKVLCTALTLFMSGTTQIWSLDARGAEFTNGPISFEQAFRVYRPEWESTLNNGLLTPEGMNNFRALYVPLSQGVAQDPEYKYWLFRSLHRIQECQKIHQFKFSPEFIAFLRGMPGTQACQFFLNYSLSPQ